MSPGTSVRGLRNRRSRPRLPPWAALCLVAFLPLPARAAPPQAVAGRVVVELTDAGARDLRAGRLRLPLPAGGTSRSPHLAPLFVADTGPLARYAVLTFRPEASDGPDPGAVDAVWIEALRTSPAVTRAEPDLVYRLAALPNDPYFAGSDSLPAQFHLWNPGGLSLNAAAAWPYLPAGRDVVVGVLDSGVDWHHPDLAGPDPPGDRIWVNTAEASGIPGVDDDGNGFVDDTVGWDFVHLTTPPGGDANPAPGEDSATPDADPSDQAGHGTQVAGIVTAITGNGIGLAAAAPCARIMPVRVAWLGQNGDAFTIMSFCAQGVEYAARNGARIINCSWDSADQSGLGAAVDEAIQVYDVVVVASAGNAATTNTAIEYLGSRDDVLGVAGIEATGKKASKSNYGSWVNIAAFYRGMPSTSYNRSSLMSIYLVNPNGGTSFSAPQVAAEAALLRALNPLADAATVRNAIVTTGRDLTDLEPVYASGLGGGLADFRAAMQAMGGGWDDSVEVHGLLPAPDLLAFACLTDSTVNVFDSGSGSATTGWSGGVSRNVPGVSMLDPVWAGWEDGTASVLVFADGNELRAVRDAGTPVAGWPQALPGDATGLLAAPRGQGGEVVLVPGRTDVLVLESNGGGVSRRYLGFGAVAIAASAPAPDSTVLFAGVDTTGALVLWRDGPQGTGAPVATGLRSGPAPVIGEFQGPGTPEVVCAAPDSIAPATLQHIVFVEPNGTADLTVDLAAPPVEFLSLAGFSLGLRVVVVAVDEAGGVHLVDRSGTVTSAAAPGRAAGEMLCADVTGDAVSDLLLLTRDGILAGWTSDLQPLDGFPRVFPRGFTSGPIVADGNGTRFVVLADTAGTLWSLPLGPSLRPDPWTARGGGPGRSRFLGFDRATPVAPQAALHWNAPGTLCWEGANLDGLLGLRVAGTGGPLWQGAVSTPGCADVNAAPGERVRLLGLRRDGVWIELASTVGPGTGAGVPGLRADMPSPNPFRDEARLRWSGARGAVRIEVLDVRGRLVVARSLPGDSGEFRWDGTDDAGGRAAPGLYFLRVADGRDAAVRRVLRIP